MPPQKLVPEMLMPLKRLLSFYYLLSTPPSLLRELKLSRSTIYLSLNTWLTCTRVFGLRSCHGLPLVTCFTAFIGKMDGSQTNRVYCLDWFCLRASLSMGRSFSHATVMFTCFFYDLLMDNCSMEAVIFSLLVLN